MMQHGAGLAARPPVRNNLEVGRRGILFLRFSAHEVGLVLDLQPAKLQAGDNSYVPRHRRRPPSPVQEVLHAGREMVIVEQMQLAEDDTKLIHELEIYEGGRTTNLLPHRAGSVSSSHRPTGDYRSHSPELPRGAS
jgi:hypothetical protein